jgi:hypothetical protein
MIWGDVFSGFVRQLTEFFGASHPIRLGVAISLGIASQGALRVCVPIFHIEAINTAAELSCIYYIAAWIAVFFLPLTFGWRGAPEEAVNKFRKLRLMIDQPIFSLPLQKAIWREAIQKQIDADLSNRQLSVKSLFEQAKAKADRQINDG